jgi:hypothetical protein
MNQATNYLSIQEFIKNNQYSINPIYFDRFWETISNKTWIYIDDELIEWVGYKMNVITAKQKYMDIIKKNFTENQDYKIYNYDQVKDIFHISQEIYENNDAISPFKDRILNNLHNRSLYIILHPRCFKKSLMMIRTTRANDIRDYYVDIEEIYLDYSKYQLSLENKELKIQLAKEKENKKIEKHELLLTKMKNKKCIYLIEIIDLSNIENVFIKIGYTKDLETRHKMLKQRFKKICILDVFEYNDSYELEQLILNDGLIRNNLYKDLVNGSKSVEIIKLSNEFTYNQIFEIVNKYMNNECMHNNMRLLEIRKLDIEEKKINLINSLLEKNLDINSIIDYLSKMQNSHEMSIYNQELPVLSFSTDYPKIQYIKSMKRPTSKSINKINPESLEILKTYNTLSALLIEEEQLHVNQKGIYKAIKENLIYKDFRWNYVGDEILPNSVLENRTFTVVPIIKLNINRTEIIDSYASLKSLAALEKRSTNTLKKIIEKQTEYNNGYYLYFNDCPKELIKNYESNGNRINKFRSKFSRTIIKTDPNNNIEYIYNSLSDALLKNHLNNYTLKYAIENNTLLDGFYWKYGN